MTEKKPSTGMTKPSKGEIVNALDDLLCWATGSSKSNNPYTYQEVRQALIVLGRQYGYEGDFYSVKLKGRDYSG